jgi:hypothetical protein
LKKIKLAIMSEIKAAFDEALSLADQAKNSLDLHGAQSKNYRQLIERAVDTIRPYNDLKEIKPVIEELYDKIELENLPDEANENKEDNKFEKLLQSIREAALAFDIVYENVE